MSKSGYITEDCGGLAIASVPKQKMGELYDVKTALKKGTIFKNLDMPFFMGGDQIGK
jgi:hypothetical protein